MSAQDKPMRIDFYLETKVGEEGLSVYGAVSIPSSWKNAKELFLYKLTSVAGRHFDSLVKEVAKE